jgi:MOSC domain-containing protein YiiM
MTQTALGRILEIAVKTARGGPMRAIDSAQAVVDGGLTEDLPVSKKRGITFVSTSSWQDTLADLNAEVPWTARRANVLVEGPGLAEWIGHRVRCGEVELLIHGETTPCSMMDDQFQGLQAALAPECRAGVYGQVLKSGCFKIGDPIELLD